MITKEITICSKQVKLMYCAAAENGFENFSGKSIFDFDHTKNADRLHLAMACIVAAYSADDQEPPVSSEDILYKATQKELLGLYIAAIALRNEWYGVSKVLSDQLTKEEESLTEEERKESEKNAEAPANGSQSS